MRIPTPLLARTGLVLFLLLSLPLPAVQEPSPDPAAPRLPTQLFTIRFKDINDVYLLIEPLLSARGSVRMRPRLRTLAVSDDPETLEKIEAMIQGYDLPPRNVEVSLQLILATAAGKPPETISPRIRGVIRKLNEISTRWSDYRLLGSATVVSSEGEKTSVEMGEDYRISFAVDYASDKPRLVRFQRFTLDRRERSRDPEIRAETFTRVLDTALNLKEDKLYIFGASKMESSNRALFMTITASTQR